MNVMEAKSKLVEWCTSQVGTREGANNYNKYAADPRITQLLGWNAQNQPWCDIFTDAAFVECFGLQIGAAMTYQPIGGGSALCSASAQFFKNNGAWYSSPEVGDVVFFLVNGGINHQGIVTGVSGSTLATVEGNSSDAVSRRTYTIGSSQIAGYGRPKWELAASAGSEDGKKTEEKKPEKQSKLPVLKRGSRGDAVVLLQAALNWTGFNSGTADGDFGPLTLAAVKSFQESAKISIDGEVGEETWRALLLRVMGGAV